MDSEKQKMVLVQYVAQYMPIVDKTLNVLRVNNNQAQIPYAQFPSGCSRHVIRTRCSPR